MAIKLNIVRPATAVQTAKSSGFLYKDLAMDILVGSVDNPELYALKNNSDLASLYDVKSVLNSVKNILITSPGEKLLNPTFGINLYMYLFEPISETRGFFIGTDLYNGITSQEPRVTVDFIRVIADIEEQQYDINIQLSIPSLNINSLSLDGILNNSGYVLL